MKIESITGIPPTNIRLRNYYIINTTLIDICIAFHSLIILYAEHSA